MLGLGLRLTLAGGREAIARLALIAVAVSVGVGLLLATLASLNAVHAQNSRYAWLETGYPGSNAPAAAPSAAPNTPEDVLWWRLSADYYQGSRIGRVDLAASGPDSPIPPGIGELPGPRQFYASPALSRLLSSTPTSQLADRYPGEQIGIIGPAALPAPNSLLIIIGYSAEELSHRDDVVQVTAISTTDPDQCTGQCAPAVGIDLDGMTLILSVVLAALLFPLLIFVGGATRLSAARREHRFAAMRLIGATPAQVAVISTVESAVGAVAGVILGFAVFAATRPALATIPFTGDPFYLGDLTLTLNDVLLVGLGIPAAAAIAARVALRRVNVSPLGVTRRAAPRPPRAWRLAPLLLGIAELGYVAYLSDIGGTGPGKSSTQQATAYLTGILLVMAGLVIAGPWLTMVAARLLARRASRPATLITARRLADNPHACFRAISGLVLALFVGTCALGMITTIVAHNGGAPRQAATKTGTIVQPWGVLSSGPSPTFTPSTMNQLSAVDGVTGTAVIRSEFSSAGDSIPSRWLVTCDQLVGTPALGRCPAGATVVAIDPDFGGAVIDTSQPMSDKTWPAAGELSPAQLEGLPVDVVVVGTDGSLSATEQARTILELAYHQPFAPQTLSEITADSTRQLTNYRQLFNVVISVTLPIAGCSLAVSVAGGLAERKRPFSLLRLAGAPLTLLQRVVTMEAAAPLVVGAAVSIGVGLLTAHLFVRAQLDETVRLPGAEYYLLLVAGLLACVAIISSALPLLRRMTGPEVARND